MGPKVLAWNGLGGYSFPRFSPSGSCTFSDHYMDNLTSQLHLLHIEIFQILRPLRSTAHEDKPLSSCSMDIGVRGNSRQAFVLARKRYSSGSQLYFVRWGSEPVPNDAVQSGRPPRIYEDFKIPGRHSYKILRISNYGDLRPATTSPCRCSHANTEVKFANKYIAILTHLLRHWRQIRTRT